MSDIEEVRGDLDAAYNVLRPAVNQVIDMMLADLRTNAIDPREK